MNVRELYQEVILDHGRRPRNFAIPPGATHHAEGKNPLCGDHIILGAIIEGGAIREIGFQGAGCAICTAATSTMTELVKGKSHDEVRRIFQGFQDVVTGKVEPDLEALGKLAVFAGVREFPMRVKCATLGWHTLEAALSGDTTATTE